MQRIKIRLIFMGCGYDTRSIKLMEWLLMQNVSEVPHHNLLQKKQRTPRRLWRMLRRKKVQSPLRNAFDNITSEVDLECFELDLPAVVYAKEQLLESRLFRRRPWLKELKDYPKLVPVDFNNLSATEHHALERILSGDNTDAGNVNNIVLFEGVMIYLDEGVPHSLLELCSNSLRKYSSSDGSSGYMCFADRLENIPGGDEDAAHIEMESTGWELMDWLSKPGLARHMVCPE